MKRTNNMTEMRLRNIIKESVKKVINENTDGIGYNSQVVDDWYEIREVMGDSAVCDAIFEYIGQEQARKFIDFVKRVYLDDYYNQEDE